MLSVSVRLLGSEIIVYFPVTEAVELQWNIFKSCLQKYLSLGSKETIAATDGVIRNLTSVKKMQEKYKI
jgi:hypothetical protein